MIAPALLAVTLTLGADAGGSYRAVYGTHVTGAEFQADVGVNVRGGAVLLSSDLLRGDTQYDLATWDGHIAPMYELRLKRFRFGGGPAIGYFQIQRITQPDHPFWALTLGGEALATADIVQFGGKEDDPSAPAHAFYAALRFHLDVSPGHDAGASVLWGPTLALGIRY